MAQENNDGISEILLSLQTNAEDSETLLPTLTLYTGERINSDPKPPINLQLSLGGSYSENPDATPDVLQSDNSSMLKRSYLEQNEMAQANQEEIILINNVQGIRGARQKSKKRNGPIDPEWAAQSASENPALLRALKVIRSEVSQQQEAEADCDQCDTSDKTHAIQGVPLQPELVFQEIEPGNFYNPDDFLSTSPPPCDVNVDIGLSMPSEEPAREVAVTSSMMPTALMDVSGVTSNVEIQPLENLAVPLLFPTRIDKGKSIMVQERSESETLSDTSGDENLMTNFYGSKSGPEAFATTSSSSRSKTYLPQGAIEEIDRLNPVLPTFFPNSQAAMQMANPIPPFMAASSSKQNAISDLMHYDPYQAPAANTNSFPKASDLASNPWANALIPVAVPIYGSTSGNGSNAVIPQKPATEHPLQRNGNAADAQVELLRNMPTVATNGGIPNGRRIEGFLYKYSKYNEVVIVCHCHGGFFSPREFIMHAGGGAVENPLSLITVTPAAY